MFAFAAGRSVVPRPRFFVSPGQGICSGRRVGIRRCVEQGPLSRINLLAAGSKEPFDQQVHVLFELLDATVSLFDRGEELVYELLQQLRIVGQRGGLRKRNVRARVDDYAATSEKVSDAQRFCILFCILCST